MGRARSRMWVNGTSDVISYLVFLRRLLQGRYKYSRNHIRFDHLNLFKKHIN